MSGNAGDLLDSVAALDWSGRAITGADLRALLDQGGIMGLNYVIPSAANMEELAKFIRALQQRFKIGNSKAWTDRDIEINEASKKVIESIVNLQELLPVIISNSRAVTISPSISGISDFDFQESAWKLYEVVNRLGILSALVSLQESRISKNYIMRQSSEAWDLPAPSATREIHKWHHFVEAIAEKFRDVVADSNPGKPRLKIGSGDRKNVLINFLVAVIPHISEETPPTSDAVRKQLQRAAKGDKQS